MYKHPSVNAVAQGNSPLRIIHSTIDFKVVRSRMVLDIFVIDCAGNQIQAQAATLVIDHLRPIHLPDIDASHLEFETPYRFVVQYRGHYKLYEKPFRMTSESGSHRMPPPPPPCQNFYLFSL